MRTQLAEHSTASSEESDRSAAEPFSEESESETDSEAESDKRQRSPALGASGSKQRRGVSTRQPVSKQQRRDLRKRRAPDSPEQPATPDLSAAKDTDAAGKKLEAAVVAPSFAAEAGAICDLVSGWPSFDAPDAVVHQAGLSKGTCPGSEIMCIRIGAKLLSDVCVVLRRASTFRTGVTFLWKSGKQRRLSQHMWPLSTRRASRWLLGMTSGMSAM